MNQVVLVGRIERIVKKDEEQLILTMSVPAFSKNEKESRVIDMINCTLLGNVAKQTAEYCKVNDVVGIRGRIQKRGQYPMEIIAEKVTFLSSKTYEQDV